MKYFIISEEQIENLKRFSITLGRLQNSEQWTEEKELKISEMIDRHIERLKEIPDFVDMIVGYSTPNPREIEIWNRNDQGNLE